MLAAVRGTGRGPGLRIALPAGRRGRCCAAAAPEHDAQVPGLTPWVRRATVLRGLGAELLAPLRFKEELVGAVVLGLKYTGEAYNPPISS